MDSDHGARRRQVLGVGVAVIGSAIVKPARAQAKVSQAQAQYQDKPKDGHQCDGCAQFVTPSSCKLVDGKIDPKGWCLFWVQKPS